LKEKDIHDPGGIGTRNPSKRAAANPTLRQRGYWDWHKEFKSGFDVIIKLFVHNLKNFALFPTFISSLGELLLDVQGDSK